ncbi:lipid A biosynthesis lauroyl acyltransferase [Aliikangiella marina]|uniref:Lipid A biosynthesis lauroyl acyltransferase n=1 Tax=Aliikangiella marina TaxID=1712262 RepID=A0A545TJQ4_9GAMM|nr:lysophospholipid acyltransferase family protein [Aliikangiella marina]TQV77459.1 lipid A biosynthesis lauroyl acyltransferase [Aliikangiella marina]
MALKINHFIKHPTDLGGLILVGFAWLLAKLPLTVQLQFANLLGKLFYRCLPKRRKIAATNLALCFPDKTAEERQSILEENFRQSALAMIEVAACWFSDLSSRKKYSSLIGKEHLDAAQAEGNGVILLIFHFTSMELGGCLLGSHVEFNAMYKPTRNRLVEQTMCKGRLRHIKGLITQDDAKSAIKALRNNEIVWYSTDQNYGNDSRHKNSVFVPFFDIPARTITGLSRFAKISGAKVVPLTHRRTHEGKGIELELYPALDNFPSDSPTEDAAKVNRFLERFLKKEPANYLWVHKRFRSRPPGAPSIY